MSWDLSGTYALSKTTNLYARVATGFRASSVQGAGAFNDQSVAGPETNTSFEAGVKADLLDGRARVDFGVFYYEVKDQQLTAVGGAANSNILLNAKKSVGQGFELDSQAYLTDNLLATLGVGYNDTKIKDPNLAVAVCAPCTVTDPTIPDPTRGSAWRRSTATRCRRRPKTTVNFTLRYGLPVGGGGEWYVYTDWVYRSKVNFFLYESVEFTGKSLTEGGLRVGYLWGNGKYEAAAFVRNITDQIRVVGGIDFNNLTGFINEPRTYGGAVQGAVLMPRRAAARQRHGPPRLNRSGAARGRSRTRGSRPVPARAPQRQGTSDARPACPSRPDRAQRQRRLAQQRSGLLRRRAARHQPVVGVERHAQAGAAQRR